MAGHRAISEADVKAGSEAKSNERGKATGDAERKPNRTVKIGQIVRYD
jgi:hypothetical protein